MVVAPQYVMLTLTPLEAQRFLLASLIYWFKFRNSNANRIFLTAILLLSCIHTVYMPYKGYQTITVSQQVYEKVKKKAEKESKSVSSYAGEILACYMEAEEKLSRYAPFIELFGFEGNSVILRDHKINRVVDVYLHEKQLYCAHDESKDCMHISFCFALPQVRRVIRG